MVWCGVNNKKNITSDHIWFQGGISMRITFPNILGGLGWHVPQRQLSGTYCSPQLRSWKALPKKKISKQALWHEISVSSWKNSRVHVPIQPSSSFGPNVIYSWFPLELFCWSFSSLHLPLKFRTWCASLITLPRIGLVGAATFHWFGVACDRNARRKCSFATFRGLGGFGWWCWWNKGALVPNFSKFLAGWGPKSFKVKTSKPFFSFWTSSQPPRYLHPLAATRLYARHAYLPSSWSKTWAVWRAQKNRKPLFFILFTTDSFFRSYGSVKWKYVLLGIEQSILFVFMYFMFTTYELMAA